MLVGGRKVAGILVEARLQERWAVVGIGLNVALRPEDFPAELRDRAGTLGLEPSAIEPTLEALLGGLERWLAADMSRCSTRSGPATRCSGARCAGPAGRARAPASTATAAWWCGRRRGRWSSTPARCTWVAVT